MIVWNRIEMEIFQKDTKHVNRSLENHNSSSLSAKIIFCTPTTVVVNWCQQLRDWERKNPPSYWHKAILIIFLQRSANLQVPLPWVLLYFTKIILKLTLKLSIEFTSLREGLKIFDSIKRNWNFWIIWANQHQSTEG